MVPGLSFCLVMEGSIRNPRIMTMFARPYMTRETPQGRRLVPYRTGLVSASSELQGLSGRGPGRLHRRRRRAGATWWNLALHLGLATAGRSTTPAQRHSGLGQDPVDEAVGPSCRGCQCADALARVIPLAEGCRQLAAIHPRHPRAFLEGLGHMYLPLDAVTIEYTFPHW